MKFAAAPTGRPNISPGQRPGLEAITGEALKGRIKVLSNRPPFQGLALGEDYSQGVALG
jgi:hypothetical protein